MTGPDHYLEAENLLAHLAEWQNVIEQGGNVLPAPLASTIDRAAEMTLANAQVHATLALAAATAMNGHSQSGSHVADFNAWDAVCGAPVKS